MHMSNELRLAWHKPEIVQLIITIDTQLRTESGEDGGFAEVAG
jgi:hypothetical protein